MTLAQQFTSLRAKQERALVLFLTAGDQPISDLPAILELLADAGADAIEVGIPFSDPFGEGPTIQDSSQRALDNGATPCAILDAIGKAQVSVPLVTMGYYNPVLRIGLRKYAELSQQNGVTGTIISDLVPDEADAWIEASKEFDLETIFLAAPTSTAARLAEVCAKSTGFVYAVSRTGVTGAESQVPPEVSNLVASIRAQTDKPVCVGFGISTPAHVSMVCETADGAVVGSFLVKLLHQRWGTPGGAEAITAAVRELKAATR
jgi:tryptophan synthase alpha chain